MSIERCGHRHVIRQTGAILAVTLGLALSPTAGCAQELADDAVADALRAGGYVIVMRHASSPSIEPDADEAAPGNLEHERELDELGLRTASEMGDAIRRLDIPIGEILSSPRFRAMQTAERLELGEAMPVTELGDDGEDMRPDEAGLRSAWLRVEAANAPAAGTNRLMITHSPNLLGAFGAAAAGVEQGESLIVRADGGAARVVARIRIEDWSELPR